MKAKLYIVTYNNNNILNDWSLTTLFASEYADADVELEVFVINNHSNLEIRDEFKDKVTVLDNTLRPDFSTGHLSRNWNQALVNGFQDLKNPNCDIVICCQNDVKFKPDWLQKLVELHKQYTFITYAQGDAFHSYTAEAVKSIGLWDERFNSICYQEHDYFLRALIYNKEHSCINSNGSKQLLNPTKMVLLETKTAPCGSKRGEPSHNLAKRNSDVSKKLFQTKWGVRPAQWPAHDTWIPKNSKIQNYIYYPYFEKNIPGLRGMNYLV